MAGGSLQHDTLTRPAVVFFYLHTFFSNITNIKPAVRELSVLKAGIVIGVGGFDRAVPLQLFGLKNGFRLRSGQPRAVFSVLQLTKH